MKKIKRFKDFKRKKTSIKRVSEMPYSFVPVANKQSPAPAQTFGISKINLD
jgi:hypothetical protein